MLQGAGWHVHHDDYDIAEEPPGNGLAGSGSSSDAHIHDPPHEVLLWEAARAGNAATVRTLLRRHCLPANMLHPETSSTLLLDIAAVRTLDGEADRRLAEVMAVLVRHGPSARQRAFPANDTPMHVLAAQPRNYRIHHRVLFLLEQVAVDDSEICSLELRNAQGLLPEQVAADARPDLRALLDISRRAAPETTVAQRGRF